MSNGLLEVSGEDVLEVAAKTMDESSKDFKVLNINIF